MFKWDRIFFLGFLVICTVFIAAKQDVPLVRNSSTLEGQGYVEKETENYKLIIPEGPQKGLLILFPGFPETPEIMGREFKIIDPGVEAGLCIALMKYNRRLWMEEEEKVQLSQIISEMLTNNELKRNNAYIGGFSSGGNIALLMSDFLMASGSTIQPEGVFAIDSPVDLLGLYQNAKRNVERNFSNASVQESTMIIEQLESNFGKPEDGLEKYEQHSVYTHETSNIGNLKHLSNMKIRFYTEPDIKWWQENRENEYEDMNAFFKNHLSNKLTQEFGNNVEYIETKNKGYRANGYRHPHSWSIVDVPRLIEWISTD